MAKRSDRLEVFKGRRGKWFYHRVAPNGEIVDASQGYANAWNAERAARRSHPKLAILRRRAHAA